MPRIDTPDWVRDAIFYQIFPDRFATSDAMKKPSRLEPWEAPPTLRGFKGGDLLGVMEHLDYLQDNFAAAYLPEGAVLQDVWSSATVRVAGGKITGGQFPARDGVVWQLVPRTHEVPGA